jgi:hypothetical protein
MTKVAVAFRPGRLGLLGFILLACGCVAYMFAVVLAVPVVDPGTG